jgi:ADP-heptose:LPS heptosyltransferase
MGDLLTGIPALRGVRSAFPDAEMVLATPDRWEPLVRLARVVDRVSPLAGLDEVPAAPRRVDVAVNLHGRGPQSHRLLRALQPHRLVAFADDDLLPDAPRWRPDEHEVSRWCRLVAESFGVPVDPGALDLDVPSTPSPAPGAVVVHPGAAHLARRWPPERFAAVAGWATARGLDVVVTGSAQEYNLASRVAALAGLGPGAVLGGRLSLDQLAALVAEAAVVVSGDTGVSHLATAYRTASVTLFGPTPPSLWGPPARPQHVCLWHGTSTGDPWADTVDPALLAIDVDEVTGALASLLAKGSPAGTG